MMKQWDVTIPELSGDEKRLVYLYVPDSYEYDPGRRYPVLYMFDGHNVFFDSHATFGRSWRMEEYMLRFDTQMIVVAVECNHGPNHERLCEYAPYTFDDSYYGHIEGWGEITMNWFVRVLKPAIDGSWPTMPDRKHTLIAGSSMGGLMSLYAVLKYNNIFSRAACLSASVHFCLDEVLHLIETSKLNPETIIYLDFGSVEMERYKGLKEVYIKTLTALIRRDVYLETRIIPEGKHCEESWGRQIPFFVNTLLYGIE